jgi:ABC-type polysaccharide/polyol phosphate transport system ATPase subunit
MTQAIQCENVWKSYHARRPLGVKTFLVGRKEPRETRFARRWVLNDVSFGVAKGQALGVVGANGSGKTTLLSALLGTVPVDRGRIDVRGRVASLLELGAGFHSDLTGRENAVLLGSILGMRLAEIRERFGAILEFSELEDAIDSPLRTYSAGMMVRLGFSVIVHSPAEIFLIDEVLAVGDARFQDKCRDFLKEFKKRNGSLVIVSHNLRELEGICDDGICLDLGHIAHAGPIDRVVAEYRARATAGGRPAAEKASLR